MDKTAKLPLIPKISIVMGYYNRKSLLVPTLASIQKSGYVGDIELCICDDGSDEENRLSEAFLREKVSKRIAIKLDVVQHNEKKWINPCIPYNRALKLAAGDILLIQNPECMHKGDVISYVASRLTYDLWMSFACFGLDEESSEKVLQPDKFDRSIGGAWYNHSVHRPAGYHFCAAIYKTDFDRVGGFDESYKDGIGYDDDDLLFRLKREGVEIQCLDETVPFVFHLYHPSQYNASGNAALILRNKKIYEKRTGAS